MSAIPTNESIIDNYGEVPGLDEISTCSNYSHLFQDGELIDYIWAHHRASPSFSTTGTCSCTESTDNDTTNNTFISLGTTSTTHSYAYNSNLLNNEVVYDLPSTQSLTNWPAGDINISNHHQSIPHFVDHQRTRSPYRRRHQMKFTNCKRANNKKKTGFDLICAQDFDSEDLATLSFLFDESDCNVLLGQGGKTNNNPGNIIFRAQADLLREEYKAAKKKDKRKVSQRLVATMHNMGSKFLKEENGLYNDVGYEKAVDKASQVLREGPEVGYEKRKKRKAKEECTSSSF